MFHIFSKHCSQRFLHPRHAFCTIRNRTRHVNIMPCTVLRSTYMSATTASCSRRPRLPTAQVCNNLTLAISMIGVAEAMSLGSKMGMDPKASVSPPSVRAKQCRHNFRVFFMCVWVFFSCQQPQRKCSTFATGLTKQAQIPSDEEHFVCTSPSAMSHLL